jgi:uncharacterized protein YecE (DUF72 family)
MAGRPGRLYAGTSGFSYGGWVPRFYAPGVRAPDMLSAYASRLPAVELNNTFYRQPRPDAVAGWLAQTPAAFRFVVKAQRGASWRAFGAADAAGIVESVAWLTAPYRLFGQRLGSVLFRVPENVARDDARLAGLLEAWPADVPLTMEFQHPSWTSDEVHDLLRAHRAALCATDLDAQAPPDVRVTGRHAYLRLRRTEYSAAGLASWAARLVPFLADGVDCYVFFRHDQAGDSALRAAEFIELVRSARAARP